MRITNTKTIAYLFKKCQKVTPGQDFLNREQKKLP